METETLEHKWLQNIYFFYINMLTLESIQPYPNFLSRIRFSYNNFLILVIFNKNYILFFKFNYIKFKIYILHRIYSCLLNLHNFVQYKRNTFNFFIIFNLAKNKYVFNKLIII